MRKQPVRKGKRRLRDERGLPTEERRLLRFPCWKDCRVASTVKRGRFGGEFLEIGHDGARVLTNAPLRIGGKLTLTLEFEEGKEVEVPSKVVWKKKAEPPSVSHLPGKRKPQQGDFSYAGIKFLSLSRAAQEGLYSFLDHLQEAHACLLTQEDWKSAWRERKAFLRLESRIAVFCRDNKGHPLPMVAEDISLGGIRASVKARDARTQPFKAGREVSLSLQMEENQWPLDVRGKVVWVKKLQGREWEAGIQFLNLSRKAEKKILSYLSREIHKPDFSGKS